MPMINDGKAAGALIAAVLSAAGIAATTTVLPYEGWVLVGYGDPGYGAKIATACAGVTSGIKLGVKYTQPDCQSKTAQALIQTGFGIATCLPTELPANTRAAFTSMAYNLKGDAARFCTTSIAEAARAGQLALACRRMNTADDGHPQWVSSNGKLLNGLVKRRACERALCESGVAGTPPPVCIR